MIRALIYADVDLNLIDGSSVWLASLTELLATSGRVDVTVLRRTRPTRNTIIAAVEGHPSVTFVDPWERAAHDRSFASALAFNIGGRLHNATAASLVRTLDHEHAYDVLLVRSPETAAVLGGFPHIADRLWVYVADPLRQRRAGDVPSLVRLFAQARRFVCQTEEAAAALGGIVGAVADGKISLLPPMVPALDPTPRRLEGAPRLGYAGKFSPPYRMLEMLDAFDLIRQRRPDAEFHVIGDKFHNAPYRPGFEEEVTHRLRTTTGVVWHGGLDRHGTADVLGSVHVASSWRDSSFDDSVEISTKVLEYSSLGIPVLLNPTSLQRRLLGGSYPGFVDSQEGFVERFLDLTSSPTRYSRLSNQVRNAAAPFTFAATAERLLPVLEHETRPPEPTRRLRILFAGHDFKFLRPLLSHYARHPDFRVLTDEYRGHALRGTARSARLLREAEIVFCEWCLGNAEWYSHNKRPGQTLIIRLHRQELTVPYLDAIKWEAVDAICFICSHTRAEFLERFPGLEGKAKLIYNLVDVEGFGLAKRPDAAYALGLLGSSPRLKAPHLALELVGRLRAVDERYTLRIKGKHPHEYDWLWRRPEERRYYEELYEQFALPENEGAVIFDKPGDDVPDWFTNVGFVLSTSDFEGSHQAVAEGMAAGTVPIIRNWHGADRLYPARYVFASLDQAADLVLRWSDPGARAQEAHVVQRVRAETLRSRSDRRAVRPADRPAPRAAAAGGVRSVSTRVLHVVGARPNFMKTAPLMRELDARAGHFDQLLVHTGQHYDDDMSRSFFEDLDLPWPDVNLEVGSGSHAWQTANVMLGFERVLGRVPAGLGRRSRGRQLDARVRARRGQAGRQGCTRRGGSALVRPDDARGAQPVAHRSARRRPLHTFARRRREPPPRRGCGRAHPLRGQHHDRHARPPSAEGTGALAATRESARA